MIEQTCKQCEKKADVKDPVHELLCASCWLGKIREKHNGKSTPNRKAV